MINPKLAPPGEESNLKEEELQTTPTNPETEKKSSSRWWLILTLTFIALMVGGGGKLWLASNNKKNNAPPVATAKQPQAIPVKLETLNSEVLENSSTVVGTIEAPRAVTIKSEVDGRVKQILIQEGTRVNAGQVILTVESNDLQAELSQAKAQLQNAQARLAELQAGTRPEDIAQAKAQLDQASARLANARSGERPEEIAQAQAQIESAKAELDLAQERVKRYSNLQEEGAISQDQFAELLKKERQAQATITEAKRRLDALTKGRKADLKELEAAVEQARQNLRRLENGARVEEVVQAEATVAQAEAVINMIEVKIQKTKIVAPFSGVIGDIPVKLGDYIDSGDNLTTITENNILEVNLSIPLEQAQELRLGLPVAILDAQGETVTTGEISFISPNVTPNTQLILAKATLQSSSVNLFNQSSVQAKIIWDQRIGVLVPSVAVSRMGGKTFVFTAEPMKNSQSDQPQFIARQTLVKLGSLQGNNYQVLDGLKVGDQIVTAGIMNLRDETPIVPLPPEQGISKNNE
jgi:RND family efflux transporter MFP subunit